MGIDLEYFIQRENSEFPYKRKHVYIIKDFLENNSIPTNVIVTGLRYVGKTVILKQLYDLLEEESLFLDLSLLSFSEDKETHPRDFYDSLKEYVLENNIKYLFIDEISLGEWYDAFLVPIMLELNNEGVHCIVSGSSYMNLLELSSRSLGCRSRLVYVQPFTFAEWLEKEGYVFSVPSSNPLSFAEAINECKGYYLDEPNFKYSELPNYFKQYLATYDEFRSQSKGLRSYLDDVVTDTMKSNIRAVGTNTKCFDIDDATSLLRVLSFKSISTFSLDTIRDDYSDYLAQLPKQLKGKLDLVEKSSCLKADKARVKDMKNINLVLKSCSDFKLIYFYRKGQNAKNIEEYLNDNDLELESFLQDYNVVLANLPLYLYYLEDIVYGVEGISVADFLNKDRFGSFIETYIISKYSIAFMLIPQGYKPISSGGLTVYSKEYKGIKSQNKAGKVDIYDKYNGHSIEISVSDKSPERVYFCNSELDDAIKNSVKVLVGKSIKDNWVLGEDSVVRISYPLFILLLEFIDFGNIEMELESFDMQEEI